MSYECPLCGKIKSSPAYCRECNKEAYYAELDSRNIWYKQCQLCLRCDNALGDHPDDKCLAYEMPLYMVARKKKCKHFTEPDHKAAMQALKEEGYY